MRSSSWARHTSTSLALRYAPYGAPAIVGKPRVAILYEDVAACRNCSAPYADLCVRGLIRGRVALLRQQQARNVHNLVFDPKLTYGNSILLLRVLQFRAEEYTLIHLEY